MIGHYVAKHAAKLVLLGLLCAVAVYVCVVLIGMEAYGVAALPLLGAGLITYIFLSEKRYPLRWLVPGLVFLSVMVVYPIGYTIVASFSNIGTGHMLSKEQAVTQLLSRTYAPDDAVTYTYIAFADTAGTVALVLQAENGWILYRDGVASAIDPSDARLVDENGDGAPDRFSDSVRLSIPQIVPRLSEFEAYRIEYGGTLIGLENLSQFRTRAPQYAYDPESETMTDQTTGVVYTALDGIFTAENGDEIYPGYWVWKGLANYVALITNPQVSGPFLRVFLWTFAFAFLTTVLNFTLGLGTAILVNDPYLRFRTLYRVILVVPYALPAFVTILVWSGMLNQHFGIINQVLVDLFGQGARIEWLEDALMAKVSILLVNLWLGYPYMMIICLGALQSISPSLYEAARVDGATWWQQFRKITLPLLLMPLGPLLVGTFAFNFNNFNLIWLLTEGRPPIAGAMTPAGHTDILISYTYRLAFEGARGNQLGLAAAVSTMIFVIIATISAFNFRMTGALEELSKNV